jgi:ferredoxin
MTQVTFQPSGKSIEIEGGSKLSLAAYRAGVRIGFSCKMGTCSTCEVKMNGRKVRTCVTDVPARGKVTVTVPN